MRGSKYVTAWESCGLKYMIAWKRCRLKYNYTVWSTARFEVRLRGSKHYLDPNPNNPDNASNRTFPMQP